MNLPEMSVVDLLKELRGRGCAVVCFVPDELLGADPDHVEDRLIELGWGIIDNLKTKDDEDFDDEE